MQDNRDDGAWTAGLSYRSAKQSLEEKLEAMRKAGLIQWSGKKLQPLEPIGEVIGERTISDLVVENRERD